MITDLYTYTRNDPVNRFDPGGDDSYLVARRLDSFIGRFGYGHSYVVSNATRIGDPNATIHSYGKLANGNMGSVNDPARAADVSKPTFQSDAANWRSLASSGVFEGRCEESAGVCEESVVGNADGQEIAAVARGGGAESDEIGDSVSVDSAEASVDSTRCGRFVSHERLES